MASRAASLLFVVLVPVAAMAELRLVSLETEIDGRIGVAALVPATGAALSWRGDERFAMASTFKALLAAIVLQRADQGSIGLEQRIAVEHERLVSYSPVTEKAAGGSMSVAELCHAVVTTSDNTAANLLLDLIGGPAAFTAALRAGGDTVTRLDRAEPALNDNRPDSELDTTTPAAMARTFARFVLGDALEESSRLLLRSWLETATTGRNRLRAGLPPDWTVGDKTGTGANGAVNDVAVIQPPGCETAVLAVYMDGSALSVRELSATHARVAALVRDWIRAQTCPSAGDGTGAEDS